MISTGFVIGVGYQFFTKESNSILKYVCNCIYNISNVKFEDDKLMLKIYIYIYEGNNIKKSSSSGTLLRFLSYQEKDPPFRQNFNIFKVPD
jgi:hypothetical protein